MLVLIKTLHLWCIHVFLISQRLDKVWHEGLIYKMETMGFAGGILTLLQSFLSNRYQRVKISGQTSDRLPILAGVPQGSILGPVLFMIYINDLPDGLESVAKLFADDTSLFSEVYDSNLSARQLSNDLQKIAVWALKWKMIFNPDMSKQAQEVDFCRKTDKVNHMPLTFNAIPAAQTSHQNTLVCILKNN